MFLPSLTLPSMLLASLSGSPLAQSCPDGGTLTGAISDPSGAAIVHAQVDALSGEGHDTSALSTGNGHWTIACLPFGEYHIRVAYPGFKDESRVVTLSRRTRNLVTNINLHIKAVDQSVEVNAANSSISVGGGNVLTQNQLDGFAEDPDDFQRELQALAAASGGEPGSALITVDGFQNASTLPPKSSIQEVRINPDMFSAEYEYPPYAGGRIEVYTKAGQDAYHGAIFGVVGSHVWNANDPLSLYGTPAGKERLGFELSGPLLNHKRADFSLDFDHRSINENAVVNATTLSNTGAPSPFNQTVATPQRLWLANARTGWQVGGKDTLTISFAANDNSIANMGVGGYVLAESGEFNRLSEYDVRVSNNIFVTPNLLHSTRVGLSWKTTEDTPNSTAPLLEVSGAFTGGGSSAGQLHDSEKDIEFDDEMYLSHSANTLKAGLQVLGALINDSDPDTFNGAYVFGGGSAPAPDGTDNTIAINGLEQYSRALSNLPGGNPTTYSQTTGTARFPLDQWTIAAYAQDDWKVNKQLSLSIGLRYFAQTEPNVPGKFAPRVGGAYAFGKKQSWTLHARTGLFYAPIASTTSLETMRLNGERQQNVTVYSPDYVNPLGSPTATPPIALQKRFAEGIGISPSSQSQLAVTHTFFKNWSISANSYYTVSWGVLRSKNTNAPLVFNSPSNPTSLPRPLAPNLNIFEYGRSGRFAGPFAFVGLNHFTRRFSLISGYLYNGFRTNAENPNIFPQSTYVKSLDWARPTGSPTNSMFAVIILSLPFKIGSTTNLSAAEGAPYDVTTGSDNNGDGVFNDRPDLAPDGSTGAYATRFGSLSTTGVNGDLQRNIGTMPSTVHLDVSLNRSFALMNKKPDSLHPILRFDARSANVLNHANYTAVDGVVGSSQFTQPLTADFGRRIEFGARISF